jgi:creatinine amidohydrolase
MGFAKQAFEAVRETEVMAHADEFETSLMLHLAPDRVRLNEIVADDDVKGKYVSSDSTSNYPVRFSDYWGRWTKLGVHGDPTVATAEKGKVIFEAAVDGLVEFVTEWREWPIPARSDQHAAPVRKDIRW